ncbi:MAG: Coenzyme F420 hydrogenase/dehydrogenase, beta subunit C-terminal domain [Nanoarchaeota archaeon]|nr:Coenzyme F420 hydrogenase/dehydrogenase, beta subunit C-terminal domain [Nanoarchaeota archaeon]
MENIKEYKWLGKVKSQFLACSSDKEVRFRASSGGFCKSFLVFLIENKIVDKVIITRTGPPENPLQPETIITNNKSEILSSRTNSVYAPTSPLDCVKYLSNNEKYAIVGLGCHIKALDRLQKKGIAKNIILKIGLFCNHTPNIKFTMDIIRRLGIKEREIRKIEYRGNGWPGQFTAYLKDGRSHLSISDYWINDLNNGPHKCKACSELSEKANIVVADPWGLGLEKEDKLGQTLVICRDKLSESLVFESYSQGHIDLRKIPYTDCIKSQFDHISKKKRIAHEKQD